MEQQDLRRILNQSGMALFYLAIAVIVSQTVIQILCHHFCPGASETDWYLWVVTAITVVGIGLPIFYLMMRRIPDSPKGAVIKLKPGKFFIILVICLGALYLSNILSSILILFIALFKGETVLKNPVEEVILNSNFILSMLYAVIVAPITEEFMFRKLLLDKLRRFGDVTAILLTGVAFGLFHMNLSQFFYACVLGFLFAYVAIRTNTIRYTIILHMIVNFLGLIFTFFVNRENHIIILLLTQWIYGSIFAGILAFFFSYKRIRLDRAMISLEKKTGFILNTGTILYLFVCIVMIILYTIAY